MPRKISSKQSRKDLNPRRPPVSKKMLPFADRIKLRADESDAPEQQRAIRVMTDILAKKKINPGQSRQAICDARNAAAKHQLERERSEMHRHAAASALRQLDELILKTEVLGETISELSPSSKGRLNGTTAHLMKDGIFDTDIFADLINLLLDVLPDLLPPKKAADARNIIERREGASSTRIVSLWESIPWFTRGCVERRIKSLPSRSCVELLRVLPNLLGLDEFRPQPRRGAPRFLLWEYVEDIDRIWLRLNLPGRRHYHVGSKLAADNGRHVQSHFQKFCNAALTSIGDPTEISNRQVSDLKRRRPPKKMKRRKAQLSN